MTSLLYPLNQFIHGGLLRVSGLLNHTDRPEESKYPVILPHKSHMTTLIIHHTHKQVESLARLYIKGMNQKEITEKTFPAKHQVEIQSPAASHMGGVWERQK